MISQSTIEIGRCKLHRSDLESTVDIIKLSLLMCASVGAMAFGGFGGWIFSFEFTRENPDSQYWLIGGILLAFAAVFARAAWLSASSRNRYQDWVLGLCLP